MISSKKFFVANVLKKKIFVVHGYLNKGILPEGGSAIRTIIVQHV